MQNEPTTLEQEIADEIVSALVGYQKDYQGRQQFTFDEAMVKIKRALLEARTISYQQGLEDGNQKKESNAQ